MEMEVPKMLDNSGTVTFQVVETDNKFYNSKIWIMNFIRELNK
jgi:hypothetical protein